jgi:hypothetical protein
MGSMMPESVTGIVFTVVVERQAGYPKEAIIRTNSDSC